MNGGGVEGDGPLGVVVEGLLGVLGALRLCLGIVMVLYGYDGGSIMVKTIFGSSGSGLMICNKVEASPRVALPALLQGFGLRHDVDNLVCVPFFSLSSYDL